ncbi:MAG: sigma-70 family RNA polymerase sigma factor [Thermoleophilaceae bacterium]|nr:sigma-70 family RNA polymerase sigma factor [Thermoleophilaceae bacterium]
MNATQARWGTGSDEVLMERVAEGDTSAFEAIYDRYHRQAYSLARRITGREGGAEEATQDAFLSLWRGASKFDPERASLGTWLLALVRHRSIDWLRRGAAGPQLQGFTEGAAERIEAPERTDEQVMAIQEYDQARRLVAGLPPEQREVIDLTYLAGYTQTEIAARVGVPLGTVKGRARLGLRKLRHSAERESVPVPAA